MPDSEKLAINATVPPSIASIVEAEIPPVLWHYTSLEGFTGIVESKRIWATEIRYLNDETEYLHAISLIREAVSSLTSDKDEKLDFRKLVTEISSAR